METNFDAIKLAVEAATGGKNTVLFDDLGNPSIMVRIPKFKISDVIQGGSNSVHPAFIVNGVEKDEIFISKYQNIVVNDRAYSLPMQDPKVYVDFDTARKACENKGMRNGLRLLCGVKRTDTSQEVITITEAMYHIRMKKVLKPINMMEKLEELEQVQVQLHGHMMVAIQVSLT